MNEELQEKLEEFGRKYAAHRHSLVLLKPMIPAQLGTVKTNDTGTAWHYDTLIIPTHRLTHAHAHAHAHVRARCTALLGMAWRWQGVDYVSREQVVVTGGVQAGSNTQDCSAIR
jgi:hypothetical protein